SEAWPNRHERVGVILETWMAMKRFHRNFAQGKLVGEASVCLLCERQSPLRSKLSLSLSLSLSLPLSLSLSLSLSLCLTHTLTHTHTFAFHISQNLKMSTCRPHCM